MKKTNVPKYLEQKIAFAKLFNKEEKLPETEAEILRMLDSLGCDLSPENLHCDGEISAAQARRKYKDIMEAWRYLENKLGRKVSTDQYV
jgi:hypothetical protein